MPLEIETKIKVTSFDSIREQLKSSGAREVGRYREENVLIDDAKRSLAKSGCGMRIRTVETLAGEMRRGTLTYKGPQQKSAMKIRPEFVIEIDNPARAREIFDALGYQPFIAFEKIRESWKLGNCSVELDEVPLLGKFVEIEGPNEETIERVKDQIGLEDQPHNPQTYVHMLLAVCRSAGADPLTIRF